MAKQWPGAFAPPQLFRPEINFPESVLRGICNTAQALFARAQCVLRPLLLGDIALCSPTANQCSVLLNGVQVVQEVFRIPIPVDFVTFKVCKSVTRLPYGVKRGDVVRIRGDEQLTQPYTRDLLSFVVTVHSRHGVVAF